MADNVTRQKLDEVLRERNQYRRELELYRNAFDAIIGRPEPGQAANGKLWAYRATRDADRAIRMVLRYRARSGEDIISANDSA